MTYAFLSGEWWDALATPDKVYWIIAIAASVLFVILVILSLIGLDADTDVGADMDADADVDDGYSVDPGFSMFSFRSIVAFFTLFGWTGVYLLDQGSSLGYTLMISSGAGIMGMGVVAYMIFKFAQMEKSGTVNLINAIDQTGEVYLTIPAQLGGEGKIHVMIEGSLHEMDAKTEGQSISTGERIKVLELDNNGVMIVEQVKALEQPEEDL